MELRSGEASALATVAIPDGALTILDGVDLDAHHARIARERAKLDADIARARAKLGNPDFLARAPANVVAAEREKLERLERERAEL